MNALPGRHDDGSANTDYRFAIANTVSPEAADGLKAIYAIVARRPPASKPTSIEDWDRANAEANAVFGPLVRALADSLGVTTEADVLGGVPVLRIRPRSWSPSGRTLLYIHGGGYVAFSAETSLAVPAQVAAASHDEVISIDYTLAPRGNWKSATDEVFAVWRALLANGVGPTSIGLFGDSAGGGLAAGSIFKMRDNGSPLPAALYLLSPWSDITATGDSYITLASADPTLDANRLAWAAEAYCEVADQKHPYVSPVYGDYSQFFPPTLIQVGSREIFLSHAVRHYQAIQCSGQSATLDVYEGMPHVFQALAAGSPETMTAIGRAVDFLKTHLPRDNS